MKRPPRVLLIASLPLLAAACRAAVATTVLAVGAVGAIGYSVYKGGASVAGSVADGVSSGVSGVVFADGVFETEYPVDVETFYAAGDDAFRRIGLASIQGRHDGLGGYIVARTADNRVVSLRLRVVAEGVTGVQIKVGDDGDLDASEVIFDRMVATAKQMGATTS